MASSQYGSYRTACAFLIVTCGLAWAGLPARAQIVANGGFETTQSNDGFHYATWTLTGGGAILTSSFGDTPPGGTHQAFLTSDTTGQNSVGGNAANNIAPSVSASTLAAALGTTTTALNTAASAGNAGSVVNDGSAITQTINVSQATVNSGAKLVFNYDFITSEDPTTPPYNLDFGFLTVTQAGTTTVTRLANTTNALTPEPALANRPAPSIDQYLSETGYQTFSMNITTAGTYTIGFGVADVLTTPNSSGGSSIASALLVDNVGVTPEPSPTAVFGIGALGLLGAGWAARRRRLRECA